MTIKNLLQKAFVGGQWFVGYRRNGDDKFQIIETTRNMWIADPILVFVDGERYIFVEAYEKKRGKAAIGYYHFEDDKPIYKGLIIENSYHMSYPCVFEHDGTYYMIPESSANNSITLYKAEHFPDKWVKDKDLIAEEKYVDSTVISNGNKTILISYRSTKKGWELVQFALDMENKKLTEESKVFYGENIGRPAGYVFDGNMRPAQDCRRKYGENLLIYEVNSLQPYAEHLVRIVGVDQFRTCTRFARVHTYTKAGEYEVADFFREKVDILHGLKVFCRAYLRK